MTNNKKGETIMKNTALILAITATLCTLTSCVKEETGIVKKCAVGEYPKSWIGRSQAAR